MSECFYEVPLIFVACRCRAGHTDGGTRTSVSRVFHPFPARVAATSAARVFGLSLAYAYLSLGDHALVSRAEDGISRTS
jgi:hypothetical protein